MPTLQEMLIAENPERDAMDDLDDAINALVRRGTDTAERERALAEILLAGSPFERVAVRAADIDGETAADRRARLWYEAGCPPVGA